MSAILKALQDRKVELKNKVVELGLVDDARALFKKTQSSQDKINRILGEVSKEAREATDNADRAIKTTKEAIKQAKELGIDDYPTSWDKAMKQMEDSKKELKKYL